MATDRPNQTNTPTTIDAGHVQIETGLIDFSRDRDAGAVSMSWRIAETNVRIGVLDRLELNLIVAPRLVQHDREAGGASTRVRGFGDIIVGAKLNLWGEESGDDEWSSGLGIQPQLKLPTASNGLGNGHAELTIALPYQLALPQGFHLSLQPTLERVRSSDNSHGVTGYQAAMAIDHDIGPADVYAELVAEDTSEDGAPATELLDLGFTAPLGHNLMIDSGLSLGLNGAATDIEWTAGISARF